MEQWQRESSDRVAAAAGRLLDRLEQAVAELDAVTQTCRRKVKTEDGEQTIEFTEKYPRKKGLVDRGGLKQLTGVLKDLQEILLRSPELDLREREARILRLEQELNRETDTDAVTVMLEGEADDYAG